jgi:hypothetical protein
MKKPGPSSHVTDSLIRTTSYFRNNETDSYQQLQFFSAYPIVETTDIEVFGWLFGLAGMRGDR